MHRWPNGTTRFTLSKPRKRVRAAVGGVRITVFDPRAGSFLQPIAWPWLQTATFTVATVLENQRAGLTVASELRRLAAKSAILASPAGVAARRSVHTRSRISMAGPLY